MFKTYLVPRHVECLQSNPSTDKLLFKEVQPSGGFSNIEANAKRIPHANNKWIYVINIILTEYLQKL